MSIADGLLTLSRTAKGSVWEFAPPPSPRVVEPETLRRKKKTSAGKISSKPAEAATDSGSSSDDAKVKERNAMVADAATTASSSGIESGSDNAKLVANLRPQEQPMEFEHDAPNGQCVGTLRWSGGAGFPPLGAWPAGAPAAPQLKGWRDYLEFRMPADASGTIKVEAPLLDGMSYPLSLILALQKLNLRPPQPGPLYVLIIGASSKAEERLVRDSDYWQELTRFFPKAMIELVFAGPEIARSTHGKVVQVAPRLRARCYHGTLGQLIKDEPQHTPESTIVVGFNTGASMPPLCAADDLSLPITPYHSLSITSYTAPYQLLYRSSRPLTPLHALSRLCTPSHALSRRLWELLRRHGARRLPLDDGMAA